MTKTKTRSTHSNPRIIDRARLATVTGGFKFAPEYTLIGSFCDDMTIAELKK